jgi:GNAT superfamily N-acetyltransferase
MTSLQIRQVSDAETEISFAVLKRVAHWLETMGRRQRIAKTKFETYMKWQENGANYAVFHKSELAGIFSLPWEPLDEWPSFDTGRPVAWLRALATDPAHQGKGVGVFAVQQALSLADSSKPLFLDCVSGFLPNYYGQLGFETVATQTRQYPDEPHCYDITLMKHAQILMEVRT